MNLKTEFELNLDFKVPTSFPERSTKRRALSAKLYSEFIEIGMKLLPDIDRERLKRMENAPEVPFKL